MDRFENLDLEQPMSQIKIVAHATPNADGDWIEVPVDLSGFRRWRHMAAVVEPHIPAGYHVVQIGRRAADPPVRTIAEILKGKG